MAIAPLETITPPVDGLIATASNFGIPVYDFARATSGAASGDVDANAGQPIIVRDPAAGFLSFTNALGLANNPGVKPAAVFDTTANHSTIVPLGQMLVITAIYQLPVRSNSSSVVVTDDTFGWQLATVGDTSFTSDPFCAASMYLPFPLILDQNWIITTPIQCGWSGYYVLRDPEITPVVQTVASTAATWYTVPVGKTFWLMGCTQFNTGAGTVSLLAGPTQLVAQCGTIDKTTNTSTLTEGQGATLSGGCPTPFPTGAVLQASSGTGLTIWGVLV